MAGTNRYSFVSGSVNSGASATTDVGPVPNGVNVFVEKMGAVSQVAALTGTVPDTRSDTFQLQWGTVGSFTTVMIIALTGNTIEVPIEQTFTGDGSKFFRVTRTNNSGAARVSAAWVKAYDVT